MCTFVPFRPLNFGVDNRESLLEGKKLFVASGNNKIQQKNALLSNLDA